MGSLNTFQLILKKINEDTLRIDLSKRKISARMSVLRFTDKDTKQKVIYVPGLELSGYGESDEKASEMLKFSIEDFFDYIIKLSANEIQGELSKFGWKQGFFNKQYSKSFVDIDRQLKNLNAENDKVERITLTAA